MTRKRHLIVMAIVCVLALAGIAAGWFDALDSALRDFRFAATTRPASGEIVFVEIGVDPPPGSGSIPGGRAVHAQAIDRLVAEGAETIVLDVPLREPMGLFEDNELAAAIGRAEGRVLTVATQTVAADGTPGMAMAMDRFVAIAPPVFIDTVREGGRTESYRTRVFHEGWVIESLATALTPDTPIAQQSFLVDFSIDLETVPRIGLSALLARDYPEGFFEGRQVIVGQASYSQQLSLAVPRYGLLPTPALQLIAAETVRQNRMLEEMGPLPAALIILSGALISAMLRPRMTVESAAVGSLAYAGVLEFVALGLQVHSGLLFDTAAIYLTQAGYIAIAFWHELETRGHSLDSAARERDRMRGILERVVSDNFDGVVVVDETRTIRAASRLAEDVLAPGLVGRSAEEALPALFSAALGRALDHGEAMEAVAEGTIAGDGKCPERILEYVVTLSQGDGWEMDASGHVACLTFRDITERRQTEERLVYLAQHDPLTGAASRVRLVEEIGRLLATPQARLRGASVFLIGLTRLKTVNDTLGHAYGDALLKQMVGRLALLGPTSVARLEGNAFAVLREGLLGADEGEGFAERLIAEITRPYTVNGHRAIIGAQVGMTDSDRSGSTPDALLSHAGLALSVASDKPGNRAVVFTKEMDTRIKSKQDMEIALRAALANGEFSVHYQPQVDLDTGEIVGVEALARWTHPEMGMVSPAAFIPAAEETGLIIELGRWVLEAACREVRTWPRPVRLSVNVSPLQFEYGDIVADVQAALAASGLEPERLVIEITESLLVTETSSVSATLAALRQMGVKVALDDFGTGYSSLSYLGRLPVDTIKIDQSFVRGLPGDAEASAIVRAVLMLSDSLGKDVVAEGIETQDQAWLLRLAGCRTGQGYLFSRPGPADKMVGLLLAAERDKLPVSRLS